MLGRGVKRKRSCSEEEEVLPDTARKLEEDRGEEEEESLLQQRQVVLSLCLKKLQDYQAGVELSLRRSVLLVNTLRQIQGEMRRDRTEDASVTCPGCREDFNGPPDAWGYLSDLALDDIFEDIDTSMYETPDLPSSCGVSLWPEENLKPPGGPMDLNELDYIIEILVKS